MNFQFKEGVVYVIFVLFWNVTIENNLKHLSPPFLLQSWNRYRPDSMVQSSLCLSHILVLTGYRIVIRYALVIFNFRPAVSNRIFWRNFLEHERKIFEHSWTNHELRVIQLKKPTARKNSSSSFFIKFRLLKIGVKTNEKTNFKHLKIGLKLNFTRC